MTNFRTQDVGALRVRTFAGLGVAALFALTFALSGCNRGGASADVAASVDGQKIYNTDVDKYYNNQTAGSDRQPTGEQATSLRLNILRELIDNEILMHR